MTGWIRALGEQQTAASCSNIPEEVVLGSCDSKKLAPFHLPAHTSRLSPLPANKGIRKITTSFRNRSPTGQSPATKTRKPSQSDQLSSPKSKTWKGRVARQFRKIQGSGPSSPTLIHPEGATISIPLEECPPSALSDHVPFLVEMCTSIVEKRGLEIVGIYRVPGNTAAVTSLTEAVNKGFENIDHTDPRWSDVNVISSLLKLFFRKLPDPLLTTELYPHFIEANKIEDMTKRMHEIRKLVRSLPDHHYETLHFLIQHLSRVASHSEVNRMDVRNLAIVFGPTLVRNTMDNMHSMVTDMTHQCRIVEALIINVNWFFSEDDDEELIIQSVAAQTPTESTCEGDGAGANQNLLLGNISKVEGMKGDSPSREISAKDIMSSIISAASRKRQKGFRGRKSEELKEGVGDAKEADRERQDSEKRDAEKQRIELKWQEAKREMESEDILDHIADNPSDINLQLSCGNFPTFRPGDPISSSSSSSSLSSGLHRLPPAGPGGGHHFDSSALKSLLSNTISQPSSLPTMRLVNSTAGHTSGTAADSRLTQTHKLGTMPIFPSSPRMTLTSVKSASPVNLGQSQQSADSRQHLSPPASSKKFTRSPNVLRRGNSAENIHRLSAASSPVDSRRVPANGVLKRLKTGREEADASSLTPGNRPMSTLRCGSLDSLQEGARPSSEASDEGSDLLASITSTFEKLRSQLNKKYQNEDDSTATTDSAQSKQSSPLGSSECKEHSSLQAVPADTVENQRQRFRDPSLHRAVLSSTTECQGGVDDLRTTPNGSVQPRQSEERGRSTQVKKAKGGVESSESGVTKSGGTQVKRSDSLTKSEKTECNIKTKDGKRRQDKVTSDRGKGSESNHGHRNSFKAKKDSSDDARANSEKGGVLVKQKRRNGLTGKGLKRRHTVGGTKDYDKVSYINSLNSLNNCNYNRKTIHLSELDQLPGRDEEFNQNQGLQSWFQRDSLRTSSPELSSRGESLLIGFNFVEPISHRHSLPPQSSMGATAAKIQPVPLESHI